LLNKTYLIELAQWSLGPFYSLIERYQKQACVFNECNGSVII
jgi:hypothetical protein